MKSFSDLGIGKDLLSGKKIEIQQVLNREIAVKAFSIDKSKFPAEGNGLRLTIQIIIDEVERVIFTGSTVLQDQIKQVTDGDFPFRTTIIPLSPRGFKFT